MLVEPMIARLHRHADLESALNAAVADAVALQGGEYGDIQLRAENGDLILVASKNLSRSFVESFSCLSADSGTVCARAGRRRQIVIVADIEKDPDFQPFLEKARAARFRAVISCPLIAGDGACIGVLSVHFANCHTPSAIEVESLQSYCGQAADYFQTRIGSHRWSDAAERLHARLLLSLREVRSAAIAD